MPRKLPEWISINPDSKTPDSVKDRIALKAGGCCQKCQRKIRPPLRAEFDHVIPLILGGEHRETNLQLLCNECHKAKTALDVKLKAKVARIRKRHLGITSPRQKIQSRGFEKAPSQRKASSRVNKWRGF